MTYWILAPKGKQILWKRDALEVLGLLLFGDSFFRVFISLNEVVDNKDCCIQK